MVKVYFVIISIVVLIEQIHAQKYSKLESFQKDTLAYIETNFGTNKNMYIGQPLSKLINDYELPLINPFLLGSSIWMDPEGKSYIEGISILYISPGQTYEYTYRNRPYYLMYVYFKPPHNQDLDPIDRKMNNLLIGEPDYRKAILECLGNYTIERIQLIKEPTESSRKRIIEKVNKNPKAWLK